jgi:hypothetical protein
MSGGGGEGVSGWRKEDVERDKERDKERDEE